jgi:uncharacterized protein with PQ loop repeat
MPNWDTIALWAGIVLPLWDIPLIMHIIRRQSSADISVIWMWGLWGSSVLMAPASWIERSNPAAVAFNIVNVTALTVLLIVVMKYRERKTV